MKAIGFAKKFYTLWEISENTVDLGHGHHRIYTVYTFVKNISFDKNIALAKYPEAEFNDELCGKTKSWTSEPQDIWDNVDIFRYGKYKYQTIEMCKDTKYIAWYWGTTSGDHRNYISNILKSRGYEIRYTYMNIGRKKIAKPYLYSVEDYERELQKKSKYNETYNKVTDNEPLKLEITKHPGSKGDYFDGDIRYHFNEVKRYHYEDLEYHLPILNGHAKRIKNRTIIITDYTYNIDEDNMIIDININNFKVLKR